MNEKIPYTIDVFAGIYECDVQPMISNRVTGSTRKGFNNMIVFWFGIVRGAHELSSKVWDENTHLLPTPFHQATILPQMPEHISETGARALPPYSGNEPKNHPNH